MSCIYLLLTRYIGAAVNRSSSRIQPVFHLEKANPSTGLPGRISVSRLSTSILYKGMHASHFYTEACMHVFNNDRVNDRYA